MRALPIVVHPGPDETFHSWVLRLAAVTHTEPRTILARIGYWTTGAATGDYHAYGLALPDPGAADRIAAGTRQHPDQVARMLLNTLHGGPITVTAGDLATSNRLRQWTRNTWVHLGTSSACPQCLTDNGYQWNLTWRLPWTYMCTEHRLQHADVCPGCAQPLNAGSRRDRRIGPPTNRVPDPAVCPTARPAYRNPNPPICGHPYTDLPRRVLENASVLTAQHHLNVLMNPEYRNDHHAWWSDLRVVTGLLLTHANPDTIHALLPGLPDTVTDAVERHYRDRDATDTARAALLAATGDHRQADRRRTHTKVPSDTALLAAVLPIALAVLHNVGHLPSPLAGTTSALPDTDTLGVLHRLLRDRRRGLTTELRQRHSSPELLAVAAQHTGYNRVKHTPATPLLATTAIPRLWPWHLYEPIRHLFGATTDDYARSYLALAAAKTVTRGTWYTAADALGWDRKTARGCANAITSRLTKTGSHDAVIAHLTATIGDLNQNINYRDLAAQHADRTTVSKAVWRRICERANATLAGTDARRRNYAAYQWHTIALMPLNEWPGWDTCDNPDNAKEVYRRFVTRDIPQLHHD